VVFADFAPYAADGSISAFVGQPIFNLASGRLSGILAFRFQPTMLADVVGDRTGLGETGEVLVVGPDNTVAYREVSLGASINGMRVVSKGLTAGEKLVVNGLQRVRPGALVSPQPVSMDAKPEAQAKRDGAAQS
jgi:hypothetical protein